MPNIMPITRSGRRPTTAHLVNSPATNVTSATQTSIAVVPAPVEGREEIEKTVVTPKPFDGGSWSEYLEYFNNVSNINHWSETTKAQFLGISITGSSSSSYRSLPTDVKENFPQLVQELTRLLVPPESSELRIQVFHERRQLDGEPITTFYSHLKCLANEAYPLMPLDYLDSILKEQFINGLRSEHLKFQVQVNLPKTCAQALSLALSLESVVSRHPTLTVESQASSTSDRSPLIQVVLDKLDSIASRLEPPTRQRNRRKYDQPPTCWNCGNAGHLRHQCTQSKSKERLN